MYILSISKKLKSFALYYRENIFSDEYHELSYYFREFSLSYYPISRKRLAGCLYAEKQNDCKIYFVDNATGDRIFDYMSKKFWMQYKLRREK